MSEKVYVPIEPPPAPFPIDPRADLTDVEQKMYDAVLEHFSRENYIIPGIAEGALTETEKFFISYECILRWGTCIESFFVCSTSLPCFRYLRATKWKTPEAAIERLEATLKWRREYGLYDVVTDDHVEPEVSFHCLSFFSPLHSLTRQ